MTNGSRREENLSLIDIGGIVTFMDDTHASAEALAQDSAPGSVTKIETASDLWAWVPSVQRLQREPDESLLPDGWGAFVVRSSLTTPEELRFFSSVDNVSIRIAVAGHHRTPTDVLVALSKDPDPRVRAEVAENHHTPAQTLNILADDVAESVRLGVYHNTTTPRESILRIAKNATEAIRREIARDSFKNDEKLITIMASAPEKEVRLDVAFHAFTPTEVLDVLVNDPDPDVRREATDARSLRP